ncbi:MAG: hypothetical protein QNJ15_03105 [Erythrobacter sp.]|nr:hypothetical protein [Erythrobacter sp.]
MKHRLMTATAIAVTLPLGGCAGMFDFGSSKSASAAQERGTLDMTAYFERRLADGKRHLSAGRLSKAATAYRQAAGNETTAAAAFNGLAITYDRLGRTDLAERYFKHAVAFAEPDDFRYARNLARFEGKQLRRKLQREEAQEVLLAKRAVPASVKEVTAAPTPKTGGKTPFEIAFADLAQDAPAAPRPAPSPKRSLPETPAPASIAVSAPAPAPAHRRVTSVARPAAAAPAAQIASAAPRIRTTGRLIAPAQSETPTRRAGIQIGTRQARLVRVSQNEVVIGRSAYAAQAGIPAPTVSAPTADPSEPNAQSDGSDQTELDGTGLTDASQASSPDTFERTPLALADAWTSFQAGS